MASKTRKCSKCGQKNNEFTLYKDKVICNTCYEDYLNSKTTCTICNKRIYRKNEYIDEEVSNADKKKTF